MQELRLVPTALLVWAAVLSCLLVSPLVALGLVGGITAGCLVMRQWGQAILLGVFGTAAVAVSWVRMWLAAQWAQQATMPVVGVVTGSVKETATGALLLRVRCEGLPTPLPVFFTNAQAAADSLASGTTVSVRGVITQRTGAAAPPGVHGLSVQGSVEVLAPAGGFAGWSNGVKEQFRAAVNSAAGSHSQGLIPGMVLGDTSQQSAAEQQRYIDTGLSHLSAVSGANVAIVTTFAVVVATLCGLGLYARIGAAAAALLLFAVLVGPEPSVLRAAATGLVGLIAVVASSQVQPIHALSLVVIGLLLYDTDLAVHYGFALSVAATAGIVALSPLLYRALAGLRLPEIIVRALAVALAADLVTMPIIALMAGRVSVVSVAANLLVAPVAGAITVLGLAAVTAMLLPGGAEAVLIWCISPLTWWVHTVATIGSSLPAATVVATPLAVVVGYGWCLYGLLVGRTKLVAFCLTCGYVGLTVLALVRAPAQHATPFQGLPAEAVRSHVVATKDDIEPIPAGAEAIIVLERGSALPRPVETPDGIPVFFPNRN